MKINFNDYSLKVYIIKAEFCRMIREMPYDKNNTDFDNSIPFEYEKFVNIFSEKFLAEKKFDDLDIYEFFNQEGVLDIEYANLVLYEVELNKFNEGFFVRIKEKDLMETI